MVGGWIWYSREIGICPPCTRATSLTGVGSLLVGGWAAGALPTVNPPANRDFVPCWQGGEGARILHCVEHYFPRLGWSTYVLSWSMGGCACSIWELPAKWSSCCKDHLMCFNLATILTDQGHINCLQNGLHAARITWCALIWWPSSQTKVTSTESLIYLCFSNAQSFLIFQFIKLQTVTESINKGIWWVVACQLTRWFLICFKKQYIYKEMEGSQRVLF